MGGDFSSPPPLPPYAFSYTFLGGIFRGIQRNDFASVQVRVWRVHFGTSLSLACATQRIVSCVLLESGPLSDLLSLYPLPSILPPVIAWRILFCDLG